MVFLMNNWKRRIQLKRLRLRRIQRKYDNYCIDYVSNATRYRTLTTVQAFFGDKYL